MQAQEDHYQQYRSHYDQEHGHDPYYEESKIQPEDQDPMQFDRHEELHQSLMRQENPLANSQRQLQHLNSQQIVSI